MKKILSVILVLVLVLSIVPTGLFSISASAATSGTTGYCTWSLNGTVLTISGKSVMGNNGTALTPPWGQQITEVIIENGVTNIGAWSFYCCTKLTKITIPDSVEKIGEGAFDNCTGLETVILPNGITDIGQQAFRGCTNLKSITIPKSVTNIDNLAFFNCSSLEDVYFTGSKSENNIYINNWTTGGNKNLTDATWHYNSCIGSVIHSYEDNYDMTCNVCGEDRIVMTGTTGDCTWTLNNTVLTISGNGATSGDYVAGIMAPWGTDITKVIIEEGVTSLGSHYSYAFADCKLLTDVSLPSTLTRIERGTFYGCTSLKNIIIPNSVNYIASSSFKNCSSLVSITIPEDVSFIDPYTFENCSSLTDIVLSNVYYIGTDAFLGCSSLTDVWYSRNQGNISIDDGNEDITSANWHYEICTKNPNLEGHKFKNHQCIYCQKKEYLIASIEFDENEIFIIENTCGNYSEENGYFIYEILNHSKIPQYTAILKDGTKVKSNWGSITVNGDIFTLICGYENQSDGEAWVVNNTYNVTCGFMSMSNNYVSHLGVTADFQVTIVENPIQSIEIEDVEIMEFTNGYEDGFYSSFPSLTTTITYKDGRKESINGSTTIYGEYYWVDSNVFAAQREEPWIAGNTYQLTGTLLGVSDTFNVTITKAPEIESIEIEDIEIIEFSNGYYDGDNFFYYPSGLKAKVTFKDGTVKNIVDGFSMGGSYFSIRSNMYNMQYNDPWIVGNTYQLTGTLMGVSDTFNVTIVQSPIASIEIEDMEIIEFSNGSYNGDNFHYYLSNIKATVTFKDGTVKNITYGITIGDSYFSIQNNASDMQYGEPWVVGNTYQITGTLLGVSDTFNVTVSESPVQSIVLEDIVLIEGIDSYDNGEYESYHFSPILSEVTFKNGTKAEIVDDYAIFYDGQYYSVSNNLLEMQSEEHWVSGKTYTVTGRLLGATATFNVTILKNPIEELKLIKMPDKTEYLQGEDLNLKGSVIRMLFNDGSYEDILIDGDCTNAYLKSFYSEKIDRTSTIYVSSTFETEGIQNAEIELFGETCGIPVIVLNNQIKTISIKENPDKTITITVNNSDNSSYEMTLLDISYIWPDSESEYYAGIFTDNGGFNAIIYADEDSFAIGITDPSSGNIIKSNIIPASDWFKAVKSAYDYSWNMACHYDMNILEIQHFNGKITADNIDDIASFAATLMVDYENSDWWISPTGEEYMVYTGEDVRKAINKLFGIENVDLTLSQTFDSETDTYKTTKFPNRGTDPSKCSPSKISYSAGVWKIESYHLFENESTVYLKLNDKQQIISFNINEQSTPGDIDGVEGVTDADAEYLLMYTFFPEDYPVNQECDFNGDGFVNDADAEHLLMYTFFPEDYPLN